MKFHMSAAIMAATFLILGACSKSDAPGSEAPAEAHAPEAAAPVETVAAPSSSEPSLEFASLPAPYNTADYARGRRTWKLCQSCHLTAEGAGSLVGPNLYGLFGREAGTAEGFSYSDPLKEADFIWTPEQVDHWLENPRTFLVGNRMSFSGIRKPEDRLAVIAYLMTQTGYTPAE